MIGLDKLNSQFKDLKDLDIADIARILSEHQNSIIRIVLIVGSLLAVGLMFNGYRIKSQGLRTATSQMQVKLDAIKARDTALADLNNFRSSLPNNLNEFELITLISNYAKSQHVMIASLSPAESKDMGLYDIINITFNATSNSFKDTVLFLRKIEKSKFPLRVDSWIGNENDNGEINFEIKVSAVLIHT